MSKNLISAALSAVVALGIVSETAIAQNTPKMTKGLEKCYGVAKAGKNDCGTATESCAAQSKTDNAKNAWIAVPKGTCEKIVGGSTSEGSAG